MMEVLCFADTGDGGVVLQTLVMEVLFCRHW